MKKVYIAHPFRDDPSSNLNKVGKICREIIKRCPDIVPVSPLHLFCYLSPEEDVMDRCLALLESCDEVWFYGDWVKSEGCRTEYQAAVNLNIFAVDKNTYGSRIEMEHE